MAQKLAAARRRLCNEGVAILLIAHDIDVVMRVADRRAAVEFRQKLAEGPADAIRRDPYVVEAYVRAAT